MNTSSRVPGISRNSGWQAVDASIAARRVYQQQNDPVYVTARGTGDAPSPSGLGTLGNVPSVA